MLRLPPRRTPHQRQYQQLFRSRYQPYSSLSNKIPFLLSQKKECFNLLNRKTPNAQIFQKLPRELNFLVKRWYSSEDDNDSKNPDSSGKFSDEHSKDKKNDDEEKKTEESKNQEKVTENKPEEKILENSHVVPVPSKNFLLQIANGTAALTDTSCPEKVLVLPMIRRPLFPGVNTQVTINSSEFISELMTFQKQYGYIGIFLAKNDQVSSDSISEFSNIYPVGVLGRISNFEYGLSPIKSIQVSIHGGDRIRLTSRSSEPHTSQNRIIVNVEKLQDQPYDKQDKQLQAYLVELISVLKEIIQLGQNSYAQLYMEQVSIIALNAHRYNLGEICDTVAASVTTASPEELQAILEATDIKKRIELVVTLLRAELEKLKTIGDLRKKLEESMSQTTRQFQLREQLKIIKKELGLDTDEKQVIVEKFQKRLEGKTIPESAQTVINEEFSKISTLDSASSEFNLTKNYLDWLTILPWGVFSEETLDTKKARQILDEDHFGMEDVKERILEFIAVGKLSKGIRGKILCFIGPPGVGKTSIGKSIARSLNREFYRFSVGGLWDTAELKGHRRTYVGAMPGKLIQCMKQVKVSNPVIMIDEIDKVGRNSHHGDPTSAMLEVLDPEQNKNFLDYYLDVGYDLSNVLFLCTANTRDTIPGPLIDRMEVINVSGYILDEKTNIASKYLIPTALKESGLKEKQIVLKKDALVYLISNYCREAGVRNLRKQIEKIFRKAAFQITEGTTKKISITVKNLQNFVGKPVFNSDRYYEQTPVGVVMGLAYTPLGGATLYIETIVDKLQSKPGLHKTGQMGDVMKESTDIAYSFAKSFIEEVNPGNRFFEQASLHMHIPEGATPKDGPSAGCTMTTSLLSIALNKPVKKDLAMTGELTLIGKVLPIGGVKEKTIAARRSNVKHIIFPKDNCKDFEELPKNVTEGLIVHYAEHYRDIFEIAFEQKLAKARTK